MNMPQIENRIGIIGCGKMGADLFNFLNNFPYHVTLVCKTAESAENIEKSFKRKLKRSFKHLLIEKSEFEFRQAHSVISFSLEDLKQCDLIIESITEDILLKRKLFSELDKVLSPECVITTNSSSIPVKDIIPTAGRINKVLGLHFFYPVVIKNITEINALENTDKEALVLVERFLKRTGRFYLVLPEKAHFMINRMFLKLHAGCCLLHQKYNLTYTEIDDLVKAHLFPVGVFEFFDHVGIEIMLYAVRNYTRDIPVPIFYKPLISELETLAKQEKLGLKTKEGFYNNRGRNDTVSGKDKFTKISDLKNILDQIFLWYLDPIFEIYEKGICSREEIEHIVREYMNAEKSPFVLAEEIGYT